VTYHCVIHGPIIPDNTHHQDHETVTCMVLIDHQLARDNKPQTGQRVLSTTKFFQPSKRHTRASSLIRGRIKVIQQTVETVLKDNGHPVQLVFPYPMVDQLGTATSDWAFWSPVAVDMIAWTSCSSCASTGPRTNSGMLYVFRYES